LENRPREIDYVREFQAHESKKRTSMSLPRVIIAALDRFIEF